MMRGLHNLLLLLVPYKILLLLFKTYNNLMHAISIVQQGDVVWSSLPTRLGSISRNMCPITIMSYSFGDSTPADLIVIPASWI
jgi:hypothetical protein